MRRSDPNREALLVVARALAEMRDEVVFVGGAVVGMLLSDPALKSRGISPRKAEPPGN